MHSPNQIVKDMNHAFFDLIELDPEDEEEKMFMSVLCDTTSEHGTDAIALLSCEDLLSMDANLPFYLVEEVKSLQLYLKRLQEEGFYSIDDISTIRPSMSQPSESS